MFRMGYYDSDFSTKHMRDNSPFSNMVMINGLIVHKRHLPAEIQEMLKREGDRTSLFNEGDKRKNCA
jgi:hypothetical protein